VNFHRIANDVVFRTIEAGKLSEGTLNKTADKYGVSPRRVLIVFYALKLSGWIPAGKSLLYKIFTRN
jgi:hypothetical protein